MEAFLSRKNIRDEADIEGRTAFMWAAGKGADDVIKTFIKHGVDMHHTDKNGGTGEEKTFDGENDHYLPVSLLSDEFMQIYFKVCG